MPLILAGQPYEYPRRKPIDALNSFAESIIKARAESGNKKAVPLEAREVKNVAGDDTNLLVVVQREYGTIGGAHSKTRENVVGMPNKIASIDATTCMILALTNAATGDVSMAHIDSDKQIDKGVTDMLKTLGVQSLDCKSVPAGTILNHDKGLPVVKVAMLGGVLYNEYSPATLTTLLRKLISVTDVNFDIGFGFDVCVWSLNWDATAKKICRRGLLVDVTKNVEGELWAIECQAENRAYPDARLRSLRSFCMDNNLSSITLFKGEESAMKITQAQAQPKVREITDEEETAEVAAAADKKGAAAAAVGVTNNKDETLRSIFKVVVRSFEWPAMLQDAAKKPLEWFYQLSSTPDMEPEDFANSVKQAVIFGNIYTPAKIFQNGRPRLYFAFAETKKWVELA